MKHLALTLLLFTLSAVAMAQETISVTPLPQKAFPESIPPGNYSGITWLGGNRYAVVSDKSAEDGFFIFEIDIDSITGEITHARNTGFYSSGQANRDDEGIAYQPQTNTLFISGETDNVIREHRMDGSLTGRTIPPTDHFRHLPGNLGLEALSYDSVAHRLWTCNESGNVFIQSYDDALQPCDTYAYQLDAPIADAQKALFYAHGIGTICALPDGNLLLLEREFYVPKKKLGAFVNCKLFLLDITRLPAEQRHAAASTPVSPQKMLLTQWKTKLTLLGRGLANYEGMCLGPTLKGGSRVILVVADSQDQYKGVLKDWLKSLRLSQR